ncbi:hypothetical protein DWUX_1825 [Desulfovibrio diazotrophicus]|nr:hypothetical protein DWUX_1825 [Desulfovibrio diazotrophicus]VVU42854.1 hypothetical protein DWUX_200 [Desulfovibrio diazotrophicus]
MSAQGRGTGPQTSCSKAARRVPCDRMASKILRILQCHRAVGCAKQASVTVV